MVKYVVISWIQVRQFSYVNSLYMLTNSCLSLMKAGYQLFLEYQLDKEKNALYSLFEINVLNLE